MLPAEQHVMILQGRRSLTTISSRKRRPCVACRYNRLTHVVVRSGKFDPKFMITHRVPLEEFAELYDAFDRRAGGVEKVFVETKFSNKPGRGAPELSHVADWGK